MKSLQKSTAKFLRYPLNCVPFSLQTCVKLKPSRCAEKAWKPAEGRGERGLNVEHCVGG